MILYFSGTGNSRHVAKRMAAELDDQLLDLNERIKAEDTSPVETGEDLVVVTPTYAWRIPRLVRDWLLKTRMAGAKRVWFVMTCGSEIGSAAGYNRALCQAKGLACMGTVQIVMPENYIAMFHAPEVEEARQIVARAEPAIDAAIAAVRAGRAFAPTRNNLHERPGESGVLLVLCQGEGLPGRGRLHRVRPVRQALSHEQHHPAGR